MKPSVPASGPDDFPPASGAAAHAGKRGNPIVAEPSSQELSRQAALCTARGALAERARWTAYVHAQIAEEAGANRQTRRLLALLARNGRADGIDQAEIMFLLLRGRRRLPAGDIAATMVLAGRLAKRGRRRVDAKANAPGGRRWSKGLHPGLWSSCEPTEPEVPTYRPATRPASEPQVGVVAVR